MSKNEQKKIFFHFCPHFKAGRHANAALLPLWCPQSFEFAITYFGGKFFLAQNKFYHSKQAAKIGCSDYSTQDLLLVV